MNIKLNWIGPRWQNCGASGAQTSISNQQSNFYSTLNQNYQTEFGQNQAILSDLTSALKPIIAGGPNQQGFSASENAALNSQAINSTANGYKNAAQQVNDSMASKGGGNTFLPSGASTQANEELASAATQNLSNEELGITQANYEQGTKNFFGAEGELAGASGSQESPLNGLASEVTSAGNSAMTDATDVNNANTAWEGQLGGLVGGLGGAVVTGGMSNLGKGTGFFGG